MDNLDDSENNAKISDSAYSNSCSNSQSRRSHSSKSTHSGSNSSGSSGYGGNPSISAYGSNNTSKPPEKRHKDKDSKKKKVKSSKTKMMPAVAVPKSTCTPVEPVKEFKVPKEEMIDVALRASPSCAHPEKGVENMEICSLDRTSCLEEVGSDNNQLVKCNNIPPGRSTSGQSGDYFSCVISMHDGVVMHTTSSITTVLGYPKEMWTGRSFIDFVHERDRKVFASQITSGLALPKNASGIPPKAITQVNTSSSVVCRLRQYRGLASNFLVRDRSTTYRPFQLKLSFKKLNILDDRCMYLVIQATPLYSAYKTPYDLTVSKAVPFVIRHAANGNIEYVDPESVPYLGYLPHDLLDKNALQLYHPHDLDYLQQLYETTVREGSVPRCSAYRMMTQNGDYIRLETEWTSFTNPWSKKLEFVIGKHYVVEGPRNPDVFQPPNPATMLVWSEDDKAKTQCMRENIVRIMNEVLTKPAEIAKQMMTKRCQDIAALMETLIEETPKPDDELRIDLHDVDHSYYERDSVMLGGISPHHDFNDSQSSSDTPLSYNQLNYNDNLQRYFDSHQSCGSEEFNTSGDNIYGITDRIADLGDTLSPLKRNRPGDDRTSRHAKSPYSSSTSFLSQDYIPMRLTEALLRKHNAEMEKELLRMSRENRSCSRSEREKAIIENRQKKKEHLARCNAAFQPTSASLNPTQMQPHGLKRSVRSSEEESVAHKHQCTSPRQQRRWQTNPHAVHSSTVVTTTTVATPWSTSYGDGMNSFILGLGVPQPMPVINPISTVPGIVPMYYTPTTTTIQSMPSVSGESSQQNISYQHTSIPCMMYGQTMYGEPFVYAPFTPQMSYGVHQNFVNQGHQFANSINPLLLTRRNYMEECRVATASKVKQPNAGRIWRSRRKNESIAKYMKQNDSGSSSSENSNGSTEAIPDTSRRCKSKNSIHNEEKTDGESSYYSFYSSFFKTESGSAEDSDNKKSDTDFVKTRPWSRISQAEDGFGVKKRHANVPKRSMDPPWMQQVSVTSELIYRYQVTNKNLDEVLTSDKEKLKNVEQPSLVNEQLAQLYMDLKLEGVASRLTLEEGVTSSSSSDEDGVKVTQKTVLKKKHEYSRLVMIYEEDAPFPPPNDGPCAPSSLFS